ncbi:hypothetical protein [Aminobacter sp. AP02]|uniref:hypothetical protein n=1 Tax=Aminobacter sp. AP02 TaxID=2135737 RepID=UPI0011B247C8|nr:hypothetical protein [Aminobacter sp. AP02]
MAISAQAVPVRCIRKRIRSARFVFRLFGANVGEERTTKPRITRSKKEQQVVGMQAARLMV